MRAALPDPLIPLPCRIRHVARETADTFTLEVDAPAGAVAPRFQPGQFNMLYVFGVGEVPISMSGDAHRAGVLVHTIRATGTVTTVMGRLRKGGVVGVRGPFGQPWPLARAEGGDLLLVAGGIGVAPLRPVLYSVAARRTRFRRVALLYGARTPEDVLFRRELERWRARAQVDVAVTVDRATRAWPGHAGVVTALIPRAAFDPGSTVAFVCGPEIMMRFTADALHALGIGEDRIFVLMERNMKCAVGFCGHCQFGPSFVCKDGPVLPYARVRRLMALREI